MTVSEAAPWRILIVDDEEDVCHTVKEFLEGETVTEEGGPMQVDMLTDFDQALVLLGTRRFDLLILDIRVGSWDRDEEPEEEAGVRTLRAIKQRLFVPVVFYTGLPEHARGVETPLVRVVNKTAGGLTSLLEAVRSIFSTGLPDINRALIRHTESVQRDYMWTFVAENWDTLSDATDRASLAYLLARRLATSLSAPGIHQLIEELGGQTGAPVAEGKVHPAQYYVIPPVKNTPPLAGDLFKGEIQGQDGYWVLLTPSCDIEWNKAERVLLARCSLLTEEEEYEEWRGNPSNNKKGKLEALLGNNRKKKDHPADRYHSLPGALTLPGLVVDFQQLVTLPCGGLDELERLASIDSPFAESLLARFTRYFGRLGTPDLDMDHVFARLETRHDEQR